MPRARRVRRLFPIALSPQALADSIGINSSRVYDAIRMGDLGPGDRIASDLDISPPGGDSAKDTLISQGMRGDPDDFQREEMKSANVPSARDKKPEQPGGKGSGSVAWNEGQPVRKPSR